MHVHLHTKIDDLPASTKASDLILVILVLLGIVFYPAYFTDYGISTFDRGAVQNCYQMLGVGILAISLFKFSLPTLYLYFAMLAIFLEYHHNPYLIHNYAPNAGVAATSGIVGNHGVIVFACASAIALTQINLRALRPSLLRAMRRALLTVYVLYTWRIFQSLSYDFYSSIFAASYAVAGHAFYLTALVLLTLYIAANERQTFNYSVFALSLFHLLLNLLVLKMRGILLVNVFTVLATAPGTVAVIRAFASRPCRVICWFACYIGIYLYLSATAAVDNAWHAGPAILQKELGGKRWHTLMDWGSFTLDAYVGRIATIPEYNPHNTFLAMLNYTGWCSALLFLLWTVYSFTVVLRSNDKPWLAMTIASFGTVFATARIDLAEHFPLFLASVALVMTARVCFHAVDRVQETYATPSPVPERQSFRSRPRSAVERWHQTYANRSNLPMSQS